MRQCCNNASAHPVNTRVCCNRRPTAVLVWPSASQPPPSPPSTRSQPEAPASPRLVLASQSLHIYYIIYNTSLSLSLYTYNGPLTPCMAQTRSRQPKNTRLTYNIVQRIQPKNTRFTYNIFLHVRHLSPPTDRPLGHSSCQTSDGYDWTPPHTREHDSSRPSH